MARLTFTLLVWLCSIVLTLAKPYPDYPSLSSMKLARRDSDPCCKSCALISQSLAECPADADIFCGCDIWVEGAPTCEACIYDVGFNTSFATNPGPTLELFWAWCRCPTQCHSTAAALFSATPCGGGANETCVSETLVKDGPECACCLETVDQWFASFFKVWITEAESFLKTGMSSHPGSPFIIYKVDTIIDKC